MFCYQENLISCHLPDGFRIPAAEGRAAAMVSDRLGDVPSGVSLGRTAYPKVHILKVRSEAFVQISDAGEQIGSKHSSRKRSKADRPRLSPDWPVSSALTASPGTACTRNCVKGAVDFGMIGAV